MVRKQILSVELNNEVAMYLSYKLGKMAAIINILKRTDYFRISCNLDHLFQGLFGVTQASQPGGLFGTATNTSTGTAFGTGASLFGQTNTGFGAVGSVGFYISL